MAEEVKDMSIGEIVDLLASVKARLDDIILDVDVLGCELTQNIAKKLKKVQGLISKFQEVT